MGWFDRRDVLVPSVKADSELLKEPLVPLPLDPGMTPLYDAPLSPPVLFTFPTKPPPEPDKRTIQYNVPFQAAPGKPDVFQIAPFSEHYLRVVTPGPAMKGAMANVRKEMRAADQSSRPFPA